MTDRRDSSTVAGKLPPRKRAKTSEEKEQRRVERILRNRRAAHASREKKRKHVEYLEQYVLKLEENLNQLNQNYDSVLSVAPKHKVDDLQLPKLMDLSDLREKVDVHLHSDTERRKKCKRSDSPEDISDEDSVKRDDEYDAYGDDKRRRVSVSPEDNSDDESLKRDEDSDAYNESKTIVKKENEDLLSVPNDNIFFNYLSPISMDSPAGSPIDLTLQKSNDDLEPHFDEPLTNTPSSSDISETTRDYDSMGQNSEEVLFSKGYGVGSSVAIC